ncbi:MAG: cysteine hydrolase [Leptospirales bacterium]|nr:cysteine hydrolase [Leptospirales bacterium]
METKNEAKKTALVIVDMQKYYLVPESSYFRYFSDIQPGCLDYIYRRCNSTVIPNIIELLNFFRANKSPVIFLKLCGKSPDRKDLHRFFADTWQKGKLAGYEDIYPLESNSMADIIDELNPPPNEKNTFIISKTTFSPFTCTNIDKILQETGIQTLVFTGLATSQCVETSARDSSDRGYNVIHIEDAQADYSETFHNTSLFASQGVCGGIIYHTKEFINLYLT